MKNVLKIALICTLSINLFACVGDNIADEMAKSTAQINYLEQQIIILNSTLIELKNTEFKDVNNILSQILDILRRLPLSQQNEIINNMPDKEKKLILALMKG